MNDYVEEIFEGYCKVHNSNKNMKFIYSKNSFGDLCLEKADCDFDRCKHNGDCYILKQALAREDD